MGGGRTAESLRLQSGLHRQWHWMLRTGGVLLRRECHAKFGKKPSRIHKKEIEISLNNQMLFTFLIHFPLSRRCSKYRSQTSATSMHRAHTTIPLVVPCASANVNLSVMAVRVTGRPNARYPPIVWQIHRATTAFACAWMGMNATHPICKWWKGHRKRIPYFLWIPTNVSHVNYSRSLAHIHYYCFHFRFNFTWLICCADAFWLAHAVEPIVRRTPFANGTTWKRCNIVYARRDLSARVWPNVSRNAMYETIAGCMQLVRQTIGEPISLPAIVVKHCSMHMQAKRRIALHANLLRLLSLFSNGILYLFAIVLAFATRMWNRNTSIYECVCDVGYVGDGFVCSLEPNCANNPNLCPLNSRCYQTGHEFQCICDVGECLMRWRRSRRWRLTETEWNDRM